MKNNSETKKLCKMWRADWEKIIPVQEGEFFTVIKCFKIVLLRLRPLGIINKIHYICSHIRIRFCKSHFDVIETNFQNDQDKCVIFCLIILILFLFLFPFFPNMIIGWVFSILMILRLFEMVVVQLSVIFLREESPGISNFKRSLILLLINLFEVIFICASLYIIHGLTSIEDLCINNYMVKSSNALYFSISTISTTGFGDIIPTNIFGKILVYVEISMGIFMLVIFFGILISTLTENILGDRFLLKILKMRYVKGEINKVEFDKIRKYLSL